MVFSREGARALDADARDELGLPTIVLMENAAIALAQTCDDLAAERAFERVGIVCGPGQNGGDGLALARHLCNRGYDPLIALVAPPSAYKGDSGVQLRVIEQMGLRILDPIVSMDPQTALEILYRDGKDHSADRDASDVLIVDAMFGTGLSRAIAPPLDQPVRWMNRLRRQGARTLAVDLPSGLDADIGVPLGEHVVRADVTVTLGGLKRGLLKGEAAPFAGKVLVGNLGLPLALLRKHALPTAFL